MEKINLVEILKDCPKGMELDCTTWENVTFEKVVNDEIYIKRNNKTPSFNNIIILNQYGCVTNHKDEKCRIFPKGQTTWEGFQRSFKDGDIISDNRFDAVCIFKGEGNIKGTVDFYCGISCGEKELFIKDAKDRDEHFGDIDEYNFATKEEKEKLFQAIKDNGYQWNAETKTLEKLIEPKFKVGDIIKSKNCPIAGNFVIVGIEEDNYSINLKNYCIKFKDQDNYELINKPKFKIGDRIKHKIINFTHVITGIKGEYYIMDEVSFPHGILPIEAQDEYELVPNKFDVTTLKPYDKVLARCSTLEKWRIQLFEKFDKTCKFPFICMGYNKYKQCIPYEGNEYLLDTADSCSDYYQI